MQAADVADLASFVYVGDGYSDRCVARAASRVFARHALAEYLVGRGCRSSRSQTSTTSSARSRMLLALPDPYDFALSTARFRDFGTDGATVPHEGGLIAWSRAARSG